MALKKHKKKLIILAFLIGLFIWAFWNGLVIERYEIKTGKVTEDIKIVLITDLHSHIYGKEQKEIADKIREQKPDLILLGGDIADDGVPIEGTKQFLSAIKDIADIYYVSGNHEFWSGDIENIKNTIRSYGVTVLENSYDEIFVNGNKIILAGVDDPDGFCEGYEKDGSDYTGEKLYNTYGSWDEKVEKSFESLVVNNYFSILLSHRPEKTDLYARLPFDLILSGHSHGGQARIPFFINGIVAPNQGFFPKYAGGLYEYSGKIHIVSRGVSFKPHMPRIFNPPEIVVITLKSN